LSREGGSATAGAAATRRAPGAFQQLAATLAEAVLFPMNYLTLVTIGHISHPLMPTYLPHSLGKEK
jgi:hypothetical protein